jgi:excisionase family DNA binding protein
VSMQQTEQFLTVSEAAHVLKRSAQRVRQLVDNGRLAALRTPGGMRLIREESVRAYLEQQALSRSDRAGG